MDCWPARGSSVAGYGRMIRKDFVRNRAVYLMAAPVVAFFLIFYYAPMFGLVISFKRYTPALGIFGSPWVGLKYFQDFFQSYFAVRIIRNTILISVLSLVWGFPAPIILALLINEVRKGTFKRAVQSLTYLAALHLPGRGLRPAAGVLAERRPVQRPPRLVPGQRRSPFSRIRAFSAASTSAAASGRRSVGAASSTWRRCRPSTRNSTKPPPSTARTGSASSVTSRCPRSRRRSSCCSSCGWVSS